MSGGRFNYDQYRIEQIADSIQEYLDQQGKEIPEDERWGMSSTTYEVYPEAIQARMKEAVAILRRAYVYAHRIDWYLSGDDGDETFL
jgi:hypothetical protein